MASGNLRKIFVITLAWVLISQLLFCYAHAYLITQVPPDIRSNFSYQPIYTQIAYFLITMICGLFFGYIMVVRRLKMATFSAGIIRITSIFLVMFVSSVIFVTTLITLVASGSSALVQLPQILLGIFTNQATLVSLVFWAIMIAATQFMLQVNDKFGQGVLWNFITGKYFKPKEENRIFMFLDLKSSTTIAEQTGHKLFFEFIREVFKDVTQPIVKHKGEIYQYVGDEIVISWKMKQGIASANCIKCFFAIHQKLQSMAIIYKERFGAIPEFKAGVHHGLVTVGEIGIIKKDIVFSGDVLNTTARIQGQCNQYNSSLLISEDTLALLGDQCLFKFKPLGSFELRGKEQKIDLYTLASEELKMQGLPKP